MKKTNLVRLREEDVLTLDMFRGNASRNKGFSWMVKSMPKLQDEQIICRGKKKIKRITYIQEFEL